MMGRAECEHSLHKTHQLKLNLYDCCGLQSLCVTVHNTCPEVIQDLWGENCADPALYHIGLACPDTQVVNEPPEAQTLEGGLTQKG